MACCPWDPSVPCDFVTPTLNRHDVHEQLHAGFDSQKIRDKRLFVLDESPKLSPFFSRLTDARVRYVHAPNRRLTGAGQGGIAAARNRLMRMTSAPVIFHADDDDYYDPSWAPTMLSRLGGYDIAKLVVWDLVDEANGLLYRWDTRVFDGKVWAVKGGERAEQVEVDTAVDPQIRREMVDAWTLGFGFSYAFRRQTWERCPFDESESTEDIPWMRKQRMLGARINFISDLPHLVLHTVHPKSGSVNFPQKRLPAFRSQARMTGALPKTDDGWQPLADGRAIDVSPGMVVNVLARLKDKHSLKSVFQRCAFWKIEVLEATDKVPPADFGVDVPPAGYRLVHIVGRVGQSGKVPWAVPSPLSVFDKSAVVKAWRRAA